MILKNFKKTICLIALLVAVIPCAAQAQDNSRPSAGQTFSNEELAQMLAPIALYPDPLLSQILMAATYPFEVVEAERWLTKNPYVTGDALDEALQVKDWDVSVLSLCHYPKILTMMSENLSWTARLGDAFANQEEDVMDTVQELRARAQAAGNLSTTPEQRVIVEERVIRIEPAGGDYIYVPAYDPYVIYGAWWYPMFPPLPIILPGLVITGPGLIFSPRFYVGYGVFGWSSFNWRDRQVVIVNIDRTRRYNRHAHVYREWERRPWRPDRDRRDVRERRGGEIPRFHPPVRQKPDVQRRDRKPGGDVSSPDKSRRPPDTPRVTDRDKRPEAPRPGDQNRKPDVQRRDQRPQWNQPDVEKGKMPDSRGPRVVDRDGAKPLDRRVIEKDKPIEQPRVIDRDKMRQPDRGTIEKDQPVIRDRGIPEVNRPKDRPPLIDQKGVMSPGNERERDHRGPQRLAPREEREENPQRSMEPSQREDRPERGGMQRDNRK